MDKIHRGLEMCRELGVSTFIVHPPYLWEREYAQWLRGSAAETSAATGITVAVETMYPLWVAGRKLRAQRWLDPRELYEAAPFLVLDTSHLAVARRDILESYGLLAPKLIHIHLSDNAGDGRDGHLELEQGVLPLERLLAELRRTHYAGAISLELSVSRYLERDDELIRMLKRNRKYVEDRLSRQPRVEKGMPRS
jgi:sugar phosphate isomerase/epimerase